MRYQQLSFFISCHCVWVRVCFLDTLCIYMERVCFLNTPISWTCAPSGGMHFLACDNYTTFSNHFPFSNLSICGYGWCFYFFVFSICQATTCSMVILCKRSFTLHWIYLWPIYISIVLGLHTNIGRWCPPSPDLLLWDSCWTVGSFCLGVFSSHI